MKGDACIVIKIMKEFCILRINEVEILTEEHYFVQIIALNFDLEILKLF